MKKILVVVLSLLLCVSMLTACKTKEKCCSCNAVTWCETREIWGETVYICEDCLEAIEELREGM